MSDTKPIFMSFMPAQKLFEAAMVIAKTPAIRAHLEATDPKALEQLTAAITEVEGVIKERAENAQAIEDARCETNDDLEIDDDPVTSVSDEGVWVSAWLWVPHRDDEDEEAKEIQP